jgi:hypothetical protein
MKGSLAKAYKLAQSPTFKAWPSVTMTCDFYTGELRCQGITVPVY